HGLEQRRARPLAGAPAAGRRQCCAAQRTGRVGALLLRALVPRAPRGPRAGGGAGRLRRPAAGGGGGSGGPVRGAVPSREEPAGGNRPPRRLPRVAALMADVTAMRVYPAIDLLGGAVVRLHQGRRDQATVYSSAPGEVARAFVAAGAERIHVVDL